MVAMAGGVSGRTDPFPGPAPLPLHRVKRFLRGTEEKPPRPVAPRLRWQLKNLENQEKSAAEKAARWEPLLPEEPGFLEAEPGQDSCTISQQEIADSVDIASASKHFDLRLEQFGPYRVDYTRNGRFLLLGGLRGHIAALDWSSRRLSCEFNVMEPIRDLRWLHSEALLAVAQRRWLHVYDSQGLEIHVVRRFQGILRMEFLPYHFLLAAVSSLGLLHFLDISVGQEVSSLHTRSGRATAMAQNPQSALIHLGHGNGTVSLWSPNVPEAVSRILAHRAALRGVAVDAAGRLMATSGLDQKIRIFDLRTFGVLQEWKCLGASEVQFSQRGVLAAARGDIVQLYPQPGSAPPQPFLQHKTPKAPLALRFCPFEDVLGAGHGLGFSSILVPGAGEPNVDALENNPYRSRRQRQEWEVKALLEKIPAELLTADPTLLCQVDTVELRQKQQERIQRLGFDPSSRSAFVPRRRRKGRSCERRRRQSWHERGRALIKESLEKKEKEKREREKSQEEPPKKRRKKDGKIPQKLGENPQKIGEKLGEKPQKKEKKKSENPQKKGEKMGENLQKIGGKPQKIGKKKGENPQKKEKKKKKGSSATKLGEKSPKLGFSLPQKGALERFRK